MNDSRLLVSIVKKRIRSRPSRTKRPVSVNFPGKVDVGPSDVYLLSLYRTKLSVTSSRLQAPFTVPVGPYTSRRW